MAEKQAEQVIAEEPEKLQGEVQPSPEPTGKRLFWVSLTALGIVFGDIGTSPLYALRMCFSGPSSVPLTPANILGVLSLVFWALVIVISLKYVVYVMRADNDGEGGILALMALLAPWRKAHGRGARRGIIALGIFGAALLYGDGIITPAISVLSAVEGLSVATPVLEPWVLPITALILVLLFAFQKRGTTGIGSVFGPLMLIWFSTIALLGITGIVRQPRVLAAILPVHGVHFFLDNHWQGFLVLGAVFLVVTGGEALYADMGHFTRRTIRFAWFALVLPALVLNYFGQGALLLTNAGKVSQPFYLLAPGWALYPLVVIATLATVIASQAVISGVFSLTRQAAFLGLSPHLRIVQTSAQRIGQIFIPSVNWALMIATLWLVLSFRASSNLAAAYGVAVSTTMVITTVLAYGVARERWRWSFLSVLFVTMGFLVVDLAFFSANIFRILEGGWVPLLVGGLVFFLMSTWYRGRTIVRERLEKATLPPGAFVRKIDETRPVRVPGTAIFMSGNPKSIPPMLLRHVELGRALHERVILLTVEMEDVPRVPPGKRVEITERSQEVSQVLLHFGFMENPNVPRTLAMIRREGLNIDPKTVTYYVGSHRLLPTDEKPAMAVWREKLFTFLARNSTQAVAVYGLPPERVIELGIQVEL
jgi:KUP system potassium uptake protein